MSESLLIAELEKENAQLKEQLKQFEWQPIELAEEEGKDFLVHSGGDVFIAWKYGGKWLEGDGDSLCEEEITTPTHFKELPKPPKGGVE